MSTRTFRRAAALCAAALVLTHPPAWGQAPLAGVSTAPGALTLPAAVAQALAADPAAAAAQQQLAQSQARLAQAEAGRRLQITFNNSTGGTDALFFQPPPRHQLSYLVQNTLTIPLPVGAKPRALLRQAREQLASGRAQYDAARAAIAVQVGVAYFDLLRKQALLLVAQQTLAQARQQQDAADRRFRAGDVPQIDVLRAQVPVALAQAQQIQAASDVAVAAQTLNGLIGRPLDAPLTVADVTPDSLGPAAQTLAQARAQALAYSPDVRAAEAAVRANQDALQSARLYREPTVSVQASDARSNDQTGFDRADTVLASVTVPLSDGGLGRAQVREAEAALAQSQAQVQVAQRAVVALVSAAFLTAQGARAQVPAARSARDIAQLSYDKTVQGYQNKLFSLTDVLSAQGALTQAQIAYTQAVYGAAAAGNSLTAALGGALSAGTGAPALAPPLTGSPGAAAPPGTPGNAPGGAPATGANPGGANAPGNVPGAPGNAPGTGKGGQ